MVSSDNLITVVGKSSGCCLVAGLEVIGHGEAGVAVEVGLFGGGGDEPPVTGPSSEKILNSVCGDSWKCVASCDDSGDCGVHSPED